MIQLFEFSSNDPVPVGSGGGILKRFLKKLRTKGPGLILCQENRAGKTFCILSSTVTAMFPRGLVHSAK